MQPVMVTARLGRRETWKPSSVAPCRANSGSLELAVLQKDFNFNCHSMGYGEKYLVCLKVLQKSFLLLDFCSFSACLQGLSHSSRAGSLVSAVASSCGSSGCCEQMQTYSKSHHRGEKVVVVLPDLARKKQYLDRS